jgi:hypothetical protein
LKIKFACFVASSLNFDSLDYTSTLNLPPSLPKPFFSAPPPALRAAFALIPLSTFSCSVSPVFFFSLASFACAAA